MLMRDEGRGTRDGGRGTRERGVGDAAPYMLMRDEGEGKNKEERIENKE
jgi:hypothetical protein